MNVPQSIGGIISSGRATLLELQTVYGLEDAYDLMEIAQIDAHNESLARKAAEKED